MILHYIVLHYFILYHIILHYIVLYHIILYDIAMCSIILCYVVLYYLLYSPACDMALFFIIVDVVLGHKIIYADVIVYSLQYGMILYQNI